MTFDQFAYVVSMICGVIPFIFQSIIGRRKGKVIAMRTFHPWVVKGGRIAFLVFAFYILKMSHEGHPLLASRIDLSLSMRIWGIGMNILGLALFFWSHAVLGKNWGGRVMIREGHELITEGPYQYIRHPLYLAFLLLVGGVTLANEITVGLFFLLGAIIISDFKARQEEELLIEYFGERYRVYKKRSWRFIPYLY